MKDGKLDEMERKPLVQRLLEYRLPTGELMPEKDVVSEHEGHLCVVPFSADIAARANDDPTRQHRRSRHHIHLALLYPLGTQPPSGYREKVAC